MVFYIQIPAQQDSVFQLPLFKQYVSETTHQEVATYKNKRVALRRLIGEASTHYILQQFFQQEKAAYQIARSTTGKPYLEGIAQLFYNLSHSGDWLVLAFSDREVGIDIEKRGKVRLEIAKRFFHPQEWEFLQNSEQATQFYNLWAIKESFLKYTGQGLRRPLNSFQVQQTRNRYTLHEDARQLPLYIYECHIDEQYACFVCSETPEAPSFHEIRLEDL